MKKLLLTTAVLTAFACSAWSLKPGMKTVWGEKITPANAWQLYPRPQMERANWTNLNGLWQYAVTVDATNVPTKWDGEILVPFVIESSLSGVQHLLKPNENLWYKRSFDANVKAGEKLLLHFEQADFRAQVFVNGVEADVPHEGGQLPFSFDITKLVKSGANDLVVSIWDPTTDFIGSHGKQTFSPQGCMYTRSSGIGGTVWLETVPETFLTDYKVVTDIDAGTVQVTLQGEGNLMAAQGCVKVLRDGKELASGKLEKWGAPITIKLPQPVALWSPESPTLYDLQICFKDSTQNITDTVKGYFGMRKFEVRKDEKGVLRFYFNNKMRFIIGTLDQGWWPDGLLTPPSDEAMAYDIQMLKKMGFDMMRKHIKVEPRRYYYLCDKLGILVLQDMPSGFSDTQKRYGFYRKELKGMMDHLQKVPSIVMWIPYNEGWGQPGQLLTHNTLMWTQRYDTTRLVNGPSGANDWEGGSLWCVRPHRDTKHLPIGVEEAAHSVDMHDYGQKPRMYPINERRASFLGEFGGIGCRVSDHLWTTNAWGYGNTGGDSDRKFVQQKFVTLMEHVGGMARRGLVGSVYTQTTDVEAEINGLMTYDRKVCKFDCAALKAAHDAVRERAAMGTIFTEIKKVVSKYDPNPKAWAYTMTEPAAGWEQANFDDSAWKRSAGGFGGGGVEQDHPAVKIVTPWNTKSLWVRRHFTLDAVPENLLQATIEMFYDEDADVYLNGKLILQTKGYTCDYVLLDVAREKFLDAFKKGDNVIAVKIIQTAGGQYFDLGLNLELKK